MAIYLAERVSLEPFYPYNFLLGNIFIRTITNIKIQLIITKYKGKAKEEKFQTVIAKKLVIELNKPDKNGLTVSVSG